jgi:pSer/pThr/pTyr-binding forkhead associated (FHA) protein
MSLEAQITALAQAIGLDVKTIQAELGQSPYFETLIWAEENAGIANGQDEWSYGNGATGANIGIPSFWDCEAVGMVLNAEVVGTSAQVFLIVNGTQVESITGTSRDNFVDFGTPVNINRGDRITFKTGPLVGTWSDVRVGVVLRVPCIIV